MTSDKKLADYFEKALESWAHPRTLCKWITVEFAGRFKESGKALYETAIEPQHVAHLAEMILNGSINGKIAKAVADDMAASPGRDPREIVAQNPDYRPMQNHGEIEAFVDQVIKENPQSVEDYRNGKQKAFGFLVGQVMKLSRGTAPPERVNQLLQEKLFR